MTDNKDKQEEIPTPEKKIPAVEKADGFGPETEITAESKEIPRDDEIIAAELRREIDMMGELGDEKDNYEPRLPIRKSSKLRCHSSH